MKRALMVVAVLAVTASVLRAAPTGQGGYIYWNSYATRTGDAFKIQKFVLWRLEVDCAFTKVGSAVNFDNIPMIYNSYGAGGGGFLEVKNRDVEVFDPRATGGTGKLLTTVIYDNVPGSAGFRGTNYLQPWDVLIVNPSSPGATYSIANGNMLTSGRLQVTGTWNTVDPTAGALAAPANWGGKTTNGKAAVIGSRPTVNSGRISYFYDTDGLNAVDNTTSEGMQLTTGTPSPLDFEFGPDRVLYYSYDSGALGTKINRIHFNAAGTPVVTPYLAEISKVGAPRLIANDSDGKGIAVGGTASNPIVYLIALDNEYVGSAWQQRIALFALRDTNADNAITWGTDSVIKVWRDGTLGIDVSNTAFGGEDVEYYNDGTHKSVLFNDYYNGLYAIELADNGLAGVSGKIIQTSGTGLPSLGPSGGASGFELDMDPLPGIPEPATLLLIGTGALSALGWMRRRRMR